VFNCANPCFSDADCGPPYSRCLSVQAFMDGHASSPPELCGQSAPGECVSVPLC
jgi:hypothetical protein